MKLKDQVAVVTGGTAGIGKAIVEKFASEGAKVVIIGRNQERGEELAKTLPEAQFYQLDVANTEDVNKTFDEIVKKWGKIDILVNNAGVTRDNLLLKMKEEDWDIVMAINVKSCYNCSKAVTRPMMKARKGKIINISSVVGLTGNPGQANYAASKAAVIGFTKALAREIASRNIGVNCIAPGYIETQMTAEMTEAQKEALLTSIPLGRMGKPEDIANMAL
jgi:3-oxoacyl-[acyl-carrier protein] reductase